MHRAVLAALVIASFACKKDEPAPAPAPRPAGSPFETFADTAPRVGDVAPAFALQDLDGKTVTLSDATARGPVVLVFGSFT